MPDFFTTQKTDDGLFIYCQINVLLDTATIQASPAPPYSAPVVSIEDAAGQTLLNKSGLSSANYTNGASATLQAWYQIPPGTYLPGWYGAVFYICIRTTTGGVYEQRVITGSVEITADF